MRAIACTLLSIAVATSPPTSTRQEPRHAQAVPIIRRHAESSGNMAAAPAFRSRTVVAPVESRQSSAAGALTGRMAMYNPLLGAPWTCTRQAGREPPQPQAGTVRFVTAPRNVLEIVVSGPEFAARSYIGFDASSSQYWRTEMGVFGGIMRETSSDGINFSGLNLGGPQARGRPTFPVRSILTVGPHGRSSDLTDIFPGTGKDLRFRNHCTR